MKPLAPRSLMTTAGAAEQESSTAPVSRHAFGTRSGAKGTTLITIATASERPSASSHCIALQTSHILPRASSVFEHEENWTSPIYRYGLFSALPRARDVSMCDVLNVCVRYDKSRLPALPRLSHSTMSGFSLFNPATWGSGRSPPRETFPQPAQDGKEPEKNADLELGATASSAPEEPGNASDDPPEPSQTLKDLAQRTPAVSYTHLRAHET